MATDTRELTRAAAPRLPRQVVERYSVIGAGKLGSPMVAAIASRGFEVIAADSNPQFVARLQAGQAPVSEPGLAEMIAANRCRIRGTDSVRDAVLGSNITFVAVPTPSDARGAFSLRYAAAAFEQIGLALADKPGYHTVVLTSTVLPGATRYSLLPILEEYSGKRCGVDFGLCYSPEFIALGSVIHDFLNPDFTLIGEFDQECGDQLERTYAGIMVNGAPARRMTIENAELAKIALNAFVTSKITFANMLADLCERIPGGDVDVVSSALGLDTRIGGKYLKGGLSFGGPCFPRDNAALGFLAEALGGHPELYRTTDTLNRTRVPDLVDRLRPFLAPGEKVAVLGLAYKAQTQVVEAAAGMQLASSLMQLRCRVAVYDPQASGQARQQLGPDAECAATPAACVAGAKVVIVSVADPAYSQLRGSDFEPGAVVLDGWRLLRKQLEHDPRVRYLAVGLAGDDRHLTERLREVWAWQPSAR
jgi:UDPglucose 6-dehydrogenase